MKNTKKKEAEKVEEIVVVIDDHFAATITEQLDRWDNLTADVLDCQLIIGKIGVNVRDQFIKKLDEKRYKVPFGKWREEKFNGRLDSRKMSYCIRLYEYKVNDAKTFKAVRVESPQLTSAERIIKECNKKNVALKSKKGTSKSSKPRVANIFTRLDKCLDDLETAFDDDDIDGGYGFSLRSLAELKLKIDRLNEFANDVPEYKGEGPNTKAYEAIINKLVEEKQARMARVGEQFGVEKKAA